MKRFKRTHFRRQTELELATDMCNELVHIHAGRLTYCKPSSDGSNKV